MYIASLFDMLIVQRYIFDYMYIATTIIISRNNKGEAPTLLHKNMEDLAELQVAWSLSNAM